MWNKPRIGFYLQDMDIEFKYINEELFIELDLAEEDDKHPIIEKIFKNNLRLCTYIVGKHFRTVPQTTNNRVTFDDMFSDASFGLLKSIYAFDVSKGVKFATFSSHIMMNEVRMGLRRSKNMGLTDSIEVPVHEDSKGDAPLTLADQLGKEEIGYISLEMEELTNYIVNAAREILTEREFQIWAAINSGHNQRTAGELLGLSQSYISRVYTRTVEKLRKQYDKVTS